MKKIIVFDTKTGTSEKCARILSEKLDKAEVFNLKDGSPDISGYDIVIIGGGYYAGSFTGKLKKFITKNEQKLLDKKFAIFVCCAGEDTYRNVLKKNIGQDLENNAFAIECFGFEANLEKAKGFFNKFITKMIIKNCEKTNVPINNIHIDKIEIFANIINEVK